MPDAPSPSATLLRHRAAELRRLAAAIERATVFALDADADHHQNDGDTPRVALCRRMLATNLQQLLGAADDLRERAWQLERRAAQLAGSHVA